MTKTMRKGEHNMPNTKKTLQIAFIYGRYGTGEEMATTY